ncbi:hypothetical protein ALI22I_20045 [Saccharothrix sp. ALI-22-I]|nr:hypothetical protein ALI22I_20045 [Saccharothrix sp. ALI-22-I]
MDDLGPPGAVVFLPEPGACGGRLHPAQRLVPDWLASMLDWHVWPSSSPGVVSALARTRCTHVDAELIWATEPELFARRAQVGAPPSQDLWAARRILAERGFDLAFELHLELVEDELAIAVYGAGVVGRLTREAWREVAPRLTTCVSELSEPGEDVDLARGVIRPARPAWWPPGMPPGGVRPERWERGDTAHTWWRYPFHGTLRAGCTCPAHTPQQSTSDRF